MRIVLGLIIALLIAPAPASAIPVFARRYRVSCQLCHHPVPALTAYGESFAVTGGLRYLARRNFKLTAEATRDMELKVTRWSAGFLTAF